MELVSDDIADVAAGALCLDVVETPAVRAAMEVPGCVVAGGFPTLMTAVALGVVHDASRHLVVEDWNELTTDEVAMWWVPAVPPVVEVAGRRTSLLCTRRDGVHQAVHCPVPDVDVFDVTPGFRSLEVLSARDDVALERVFQCDYIPGPLRGAGGMDTVARLWTRTATGALVKLNLVHTPAHGRPLDVLGTFDVLACRCAVVDGSLVARPEAVSGIRSRVVDVDPGTGLGWFTRLLDGRANDDASFAEAVGTPDDPKRAQEAAYSFVTNSFRRLRKYVVRLDGRPGDGFRDVAASARAWAECMLVRCGVGLDAPCVEFTAEHIKMSVIRAGAWT